MDPRCVRCAGQGLQYRERGGIVPCERCRGSGRDPSADLLGAAKA